MTRPTGSDERPARDEKTSAATRAPEENTRREGSPEDLQDDEKLDEKDPLNQTHPDPEEVTGYAAAPERK